MLIIFNVESANVSKCVIMERCVFLFLISDACLDRIRSFVSDDGFDHYTRTCGGFDGSSVQIDQRGKLSNIVSMHSIYIKEAK